MAPFKCCVFPRRRQGQRSSSSSDSNNGPIRLVDRTNPRQKRFPISTDSSAGPTMLTTSSSVLSVDAKGMTPSMRRIFASASDREKNGQALIPLGSREKPDSSSSVFPDEDESRVGKRLDPKTWIQHGRNLSPQKLKIRKSRSRGSSFKVGESLKRSRDVRSPRDHQDQDEDTRFSWLDRQSIYESDAVALKTPRSTWGRQVELQFLDKERNPSEIHGTSRLDPYSATAAHSLSKGHTISDAGPRHLSRVLERSASTSQSLPPSHKNLERKDLESTDTGAGSFARSVEGVLAHMLTSRAGSQILKSRSSSDQGVTLGRGQERQGSRRVSQQKYVFEDANTPAEAPEVTLTPPSSLREPPTGAKEQKLTPPPYPLERTDTVIHLPSIFSSVIESPLRFGDTLQTSLPSTLLPHGLGSFGASLTHDDGNMSFLGTFLADPQPLSPDEHTEKKLNSAKIDSRADSLFEPMIEEWQHPSAGKTLGVDDNAVSPRQDHKEVVASDFGEEEEEKEEGEVESGDGKARGSLGNERTRQDKKQDTSSSEPSSVHLYNMRIPELLASREIIPSISMPHLRTDSGDTGSAQGIISDTSKAKPRHKLSTLSLPMASKPILSASSSVYTGDSKYLTPAESHENSVIHLPPQSPGQLIKGTTGASSTDGRTHSSDEIISVRPSSGKAIDLDRLERRTRDTSFHSSKESLTNRELASAAARIVPLDRRAQTFRQPKSSWFKEHFDEVSREIEKTNPRNRGIVRRWSWWDGAADQPEPPGSLRVIGYGSRSSRFSIVGGKSGEGTSSAWERALKEHAREDRNLARTRLGSGAPSPRSGSSASVIRRSHPGPMSSVGEGESGEEITVPKDAVVRDHDAASRRRDEGPIDIRARLAAYRLPPPPPKPQPPPVSTPAGPLDDHRATRGRSRSRSSSSLSAWARYPSHELGRRSPASAGEADGVWTRDFALEHSTSSLSPPSSPHPLPSPPPPSPLHRHQTPARLLLGRSTKKVVGKSRSMTFGQSVAETLKGVFRMTSLELHRRYAVESRGHRSSVSDGRLVDYPELEMLSPLPPPQPAAVSSPLPVARGVGGSPHYHDRPWPSREWTLGGVGGPRRSRSEESVVRREVIARPSSVPPPSSSSPSTSLMPTAAGLVPAVVVEEPVPGARTWSKMYRECIGGDPSGDDTQTAVAAAPGAGAGASLFLGAGDWGGGTSGRGEGRRRHERSMSHIGPLDVFVDDVDVDGDGDGDGEREV